MIPVFLIGGGWRAEIFPQTYGRFLQAGGSSKRRIAIIVAEEDGSDASEQFLRFFRAFESMGLKSDEAFETIVSAENPLTLEKLSEIQPTGVFVCGGLTPAYHEALCRNTAWLEYLSGNKIPYCGFSAGAAIAAETAVIGGWRRKTGTRIVEIADENAGEDLDFLDVRKGLGLVPFAVDVHATQWGTLTRLAHAVDAGLAAQGYAIDENTLLEFSEQKIAIRGAGNAYRVRRAGKISLEILQAEKDPTF